MHGKTRYSCGMRLLNLKEAKYPQNFGYGITVGVWTDLQISFNVIKDGLPVAALTIYKQLPEPFANHFIAK